MDGWVTRNEGRLSLVSAGDFGRRPISARMAPRYEAALGVLRDIAHGDGVTPPETTALLSELKGMAGRCLRRDRVDWLSVWRLLGSADRDRLSDLADLAQRTRQAVVSDAPGLRAALADDPAFRQWADALDRARFELRHRIDTDPSPEPNPEPVRKHVPEQPARKSVPEQPAQKFAPAPDTAPEPEPEPNPVPKAEAEAEAEAQSEAEAEADSAPPEAITAQPTEPRRPHEQKDTDAMNTAALLDTDPAPSEGRPVWSEALARHLDIEAQSDRDCNTHEAVRFELRAALLRAGLRPSDSRVSDVTLEGPDGFFRYEVLGADRSGFTHLRAGAVRLMELDRVETRSADTRYLVLSEPPTEDWAPDAIREAFGVHVVWRTAAGWHGPDARTALHLTD
jgi:hypothetical protein